MLSRMQVEDTPDLDREKSVRFRITVCRTWRFTERSFLKQWQRPVKNLWNVILREMNSRLNEIRSAMRTECDGRRYRSGINGIQCSGTGYCKLTVDDIVRYFPSPE